MLLDFIENVLCPVINDVDNCPMYLTVDKSTIRNAAERVSPLHSTLFHEWKERIRQHSLLIEDTIFTTMIHEWYNTQEENIKQHYDHCAITYGRDVYKDCPFPLKHRHSP